MLFLKNFSANTFNQLITIISQLLLAPFFILNWGTEAYGQWLALIAVPLLLAYADLGFGTVFSNKLCIDDSSKSYKIFWTGFFSQIILSILIAVTFIIVGILLYESNVQTILQLMALYAIFGILTTYTINSSRYYEKNHKYIYLGAFQRVFEIISVLIALKIGSDENEVAIVYFVTRFIGFVVILFLLLKESQQLNFRKNSIDIVLVKKMFGQSISFMLYPMAQALSLQVPVILIEKNFGGTMATVFVLTRVISRIPVQFSNIVSTSLWPIYTKKISKEGNASISKSETFSLYAIFTVFLIFSTFFIFFGDLVFSLWVGDSVIFNRNLFLFLSFHSLIIAFQMLSMTKFLSVNNHTFVNVSFFTLTLIAISASSILSDSIYQTLFPILVSDLAILLLIKYAWSKKNEP